MTVRTTPRLRHCTTCRNTVAPSVEYCRTCERIATYLAGLGINVPHAFIRLVAAAVTYNVSGGTHDGLLKAASNEVAEYLRVARVL